jgi:hypothetical protein
MGYGFLARALRRRISFYRLYSLPAENVEAKGG